MFSKQPPPISGNQLRDQTCKKHSFRVVFPYTPLLISAMMIQYAQRVLQRTNMSPGPAEASSHKMCDQKTQTQRSVTHRQWQSDPYIRNFKHTFSGVKLTKN